MIEYAERRTAPRPPPVQSGFKSRLDVKLEADGSWTLRRDLVYASVEGKKIYRVPKGFNTDFASVPRLPVVYVMTGNTAHQAAVVHDWLYRKGIEDRTLCDAIFYEAMIATGVPRWRAWAMWTGVRLMGRRHHQQTAPAAVQVPDVELPAKVFDPPPGD